MAEQHSESYADSLIEKALRRALKIVDKVSDVNVNQATKLVAASNLVNLIITINELESNGDEDIE